MLGISHLVSSRVVQTVATSARTNLCYTALFQVNVEVTWKVLLEENFKDECEGTYDIEELKSEGKFPLVCIKIPARVQVPRG